MTGAEFGLSSATTKALPPIETRSPGKRRLPGDPNAIYKRASFRSQIDHFERSVRCAEGVRGARRRERLSRTTSLSEALPNRVTPSRATMLLAPSIDFAGPCIWDSTSSEGCEGLGHVEIRIVADDDDWTVLHAQCEVAEPLLPNISCDRYANGGAVGPIG